MKSSLRVIYFFILILFASASSFAEVRLPAILGSHMVLQQNSETGLWGWCAPAEDINITTSWDNASYHIVGSGNAKWQIKIKTPAAGGPFTITIKGKNTIVLEDVMLGETWICSGQSNMEWSGDQGLKQTLDEAPNATNTKIRFFYVPKTTADYPQEDLVAHWVVCNPEDMKHFSAVGYFFGKKLQQELQVPIGLINANWGGTPAEVWTPRDFIESNIGLMEAAKKLKPAAWWPIATAQTYNAMINPLIRNAIAGVIWYQGESNTVNNSTYKELFTGMIGAWRKAWQKDFPFYFVQIAPFAYEEPGVGALLREQQTKSAAIPNTGMIVVSDLVADIKNIHPIDKISVANRLANYALAQTYGKHINAYKSPTFRDMKIEKDKIRISFDNAENGLMAKGDSLSGFYLSGDDKKFIQAKAKIEGNTVVVSAKSVKTPVAVRFAFNNTDTPNLFSKEGLPVNLFRTDDWGDVF